MLMVDHTFKGYLLRLKTMGKLSVLYLVLVTSILVCQACVQADLDERIDMMTEVTAGTNLPDPLAGNMAGTDTRPNPTAGTQVNSDSRPSLMRIGDKVAPVNRELSIRLSATDPGNFNLTFNVRSTLPMGAKFDKAGALFTWTPVNSQLGQNVLLTFEVSNGMLKDQETISIRVVTENEANQDYPPQFEMVGDQLLKINELWSLQLVATDLNGQPLTYRLSGQVPQGLMIDHMTGRIVWTPTNSDINTYTIDAIASDGQLEGTIALRLVVYDPNQDQMLNQPPQFMNQADLEVSVGENINIRILANDADSAMLNFSVGMLPIGGFFDPNTQRFVWTPTEEYANQAVQIVFEVDDGELRDYMRVNIQVKALERRCPDDPDDPTVEFVSISADQTLAQRVLCEEREVDLYQLQIGVMTRIDAFINFRHAEGDLDFYLLNNERSIIRQSIGQNDEERIQSPVLEPGTYYLKVLLFGGGPSTYSIMFEEIGTQESCQPDAFEGVSGNNNNASASPLMSDETLDLSLCSGDIDFFSFYAERGQSIKIEALFNGDIADLDLKVRGPNYQEESAIEYWNGLSATSNEKVEIESAPTTGTYSIETYLYEMDNSLPYQLRLTLGAVLTCEPDRLESNDNLGMAEPLAFDLYSDLSACVDEDWYYTTVSPERNLLIYLTHDRGTPRIDVQDAMGTALDYTISQIPRSDGCLAERARCQRISIPHTNEDQLIYYSVYFDQVGVGYDLRVRQGDEVAATCQSDNDCNVGYECLDTFDYYLFEQGMCANSCERSADCGSGRTCIFDEANYGICVQLCDDVMQCRSPFICDASLTNAEQQEVSACISDEFIEF